MFCGECGTKNKKDAAFCEKCGAKMEHTEETSVIKSEEKNKKIKESKPMSKKTKIILIVILVLIVSLGIGYKIGEELTSPKTIAKDYIKAVMKEDLNTLYKYLDLNGDKTFVSSKIFKELYKSENKKSTNINNYKITNVEYGDLTAVVKFVYTTKSSSSEKNGTVRLTKEPGNKYFIYKNWKIADMETSSLILEKYEISVAKGSELTFAGIKVNKKYLDKDKSTKKLDVYVLPQVFKIKTKVTAKLPNGMNLENTVTPSTYYNSYTIEFNANNLPEKQQEEIVESVKVILEDLYNNAIKGKTYEEIKEDYKNTSSSFEKNYTDFVNNLSTSNNKLTKIKFNDGKLSDISLDEDGNFVVKVRFNYDYTVEYTTYSSEEKSSNKSDYNYMTLILRSNKSKYYLFDIKSIGTYFYR